MKKTLYFKKTNNTKITSIYAIYSILKIIKNRNKLYLIVCDDIYDPKFDNIIVFNTSRQDHLFQELTTTIIIDNIFYKCIGVYRWNDDEDQLCDRMCDSLLD